MHIQINLTPFYAGKRGGPGEKFDFNRGANKSSRTAFVNDLIEHSMM